MFESDLDKWPIEQSSGKLKLPPGRLTGQWRFLRLSNKHWNKCAFEEWFSKMVHTMLREFTGSDFDVCENVFSSSAFFCISLNTLYTCVVSHKYVFVSEQLDDSTCWKIFHISHIHISWTFHSKGCLYSYHIHRCCEIFLWNSYQNRCLRVFANRLFSKMHFDSLGTRMTFLQCVLLCGDLTWSSSLFETGTVLRWNASLDGVSLVA